MSTLQCRKKYFLYVLLLISLTVVLGDFTVDFEMLEFIVGAPISGWAGVVMLTQMTCPWFFALVILISCSKCHVQGVKLITFCQQMCHNFCDFCFLEVSVWTVCCYLTFTIKLYGAAFLPDPLRIRKAWWGIQPAGLGSGIILGWNTQWREWEQEADMSQCSEAISTINPTGKLGPLLSAEQVLWLLNFLSFGPFLSTYLKWQKLSL